MNTRAMISMLLLVSLICGSTLLAADIKKGDKLVTLVNLHPDMNKKLLYTMNYQLPSLIPLCSEVTVKKMNGKEMEFDYQGQTYSYLYEKYAKSAGVAFPDAVKEFFGPACDQAKLKTMSAIDKEGIQAGVAKVGMSRDGVLFAMGRPPKHATPSLDSNTWMYWQNKWGKQAIEFDAKGKVSKVID